ncbi:MAG: hypothetical protein H6695_03670 [Deferribacteres bacterium]|nr:hypothetical protein [candidate division KSB1 bacterium]MCB9509248.1 hypothetical protein [Deferribacteres bacterium]
MTKQENYFRATDFGVPEWIPIRVSLMPATWAKYREALEEIVMEFPFIFGEHLPGSIGFDAFDGTYNEGEFTDAWGCVWKNVAPGLDGMVVGHPLPNRRDVRNFEPPTGIVGLPHGFMFMRLYYLRGFEQLMIDFAEEPPELQMLIDKVLEHNLMEVDALVKAKPDMAVFGDDLGNQDFLPIHPQKWRKYLQPCYAQMYAKCHAAGARVYMHSDGHIIEIIDNLIEAGVDILNPQVGANGLDHLARVAKGKVAIDLDLDRQRFPFWSPAHIEAHVREAVEMLYAPEGGLLLYAEMEPDVPLENIRAMCETLMKFKDFDG